MRPTRWWSRRPRLGCCVSTSIRPTASTASSRMVAKRPTSSRLTHLRTTSCGREPLANFMKSGRGPTDVSKLELAGGEKPYAELISDKELASLYQHNGETLGRYCLVPGGDTSRAAAST